MEEKEIEEREGRSLRCLQSHMGIRVSGRVGIWSGFCGVTDVRGQKAADLVLVVSR